MTETHAIIGDEDSQFEYAQWSIEEDVKHYADGMQPEVAQNNDLLLQLNLIAQGLANEQIDQGEALYLSLVCPVFFKEDKASSKGSNAPNFQNMVTFLKGQKEEKIHAVPEDQEELKELITEMVKEAMEKDRLVVPIERLKADTASLIQVLNNDNENREEEKEESLDDKTFHANDQITPTQQESMPRVNKWENVIQEWFEVSENALKLQMV